jgi:hypothetical protein
MKMLVCGIGRPKRGEKEYHEHTARGRGAILRSRRHVWARRYYRLLHERRRRPCRRAGAAMDCDGAAIDCSSGARRGWLYRQRSRQDRQARQARLARRGWLLLGRSRSHHPRPRHARQLHRSPRRAPRIRFYLLIRCFPHSIPPIPLPPSPPSHSSPSPLPLISSPLPLSLPQSLSLSISLPPSLPLSLSLPLSFSSSLSLFLSLSLSVPPTLFSHIL